MSDLICVKCGETWDSFGITYAKGEGDLTLLEAKRFLRGQGCPACDFGTTCPACEGAGIQSNDCPICYGHGYVFAKKCPTADDERFHAWWIGYLGNERDPLRFFETVEVIRDQPQEETKFGWVQIAKIKCPDCHAQGEPCPQCAGDGAYHADKEPDRFDAALGSILDGSDAEPMALIENFARGV